METLLSDRAIVSNPTLQWFQRSGDRERSYGSYIVGFSDTGMGSKIMSLCNFSLKEVVIRNNFNIDKYM